ncbi:MFS transporter [Microbacterium telephonicum]|uniref:MFS transporter n=2 Tax=Microbacterium telephonicum TaxID=1714841 RepID=A0A498C3G0_9MICO|nr:MFS transporter [Microbacterium telephonicum]RLK49517.1 MFS transporter [Microbacterium telephonicum]
MRVGLRWFLLFTLAWLALWTVQLTPLQLLIPLQLDTPDDADGWVSGVVWSGLILAVGGLAGVVAAPVAGGLSDRTRGGFGRRRPWALGGTVLAAVSLVGIATAEGPWAVGLAWIGVSVGTAVASAAFTALIADQLTDQRGTASAVVSSSQALGIVLGVGAIVVFGLSVAAGYWLLAGFLVVAGAAAALLLPDPPEQAASQRARSPRRLGERLAALRDRDFAWLLAGRLIVNIGNALGTGLLLFFLLYGLGLDAQSAEEDLLLLIVVYTVFVVVSSIVAGAVSDRTGRRRGIVLWAAIVQGGAALLLAAVPSLPMAFVAAALLGVGYGAYMAVGLALGTDLLPHPDDHARDLGFVNVSASLGQLLGPLVGAGLVAAVGGFALMFAVGGVLSIVGGVMTLAIRPRAVSADPSPAPA